MSSDMLPAERPSYGPPDGMYYEEPPEVDPKAVIIRQVKRVLHGRWLLAALLGAVLGVVGFATGYMLPKVTYMSTAIVEVNPRAPRVLYDTDINEIIPMFDAYVESQTQLLMSRRVVNMVLDSPEWKALRLPVNDKTISDFHASLLAIHPIRRQHVMVQFEHENPTVARVGCQGVVDAFMTIHESEEGAGDVAKRKVLDERKTKLVVRQAQLHDEILEATAGRGIEGLRGLYSFELNRSTGLKERVNEVETVLATMTSGGDPGTGGGVPTEATAEMISLTDPEMRGLLRDRDSRLDALSLLRDFHKRGNKHETVVTAMQALEAVEKRIEAHAKAWRATNGQFVDPSDLKRKELEAQAARLQRLRDEAEDAVKRLARQLNHLNKLEDAQATVKNRLAEVDSRVDKMNVESLISGRVSVVSKAERPVAPYKDRRMALGLGFGGSGAALGLAIVVLIGLCNRRVRNLLDVDGRPSGGRILGVLPELSKDFHVGEEAATANHCIHRVRTLLELHSGHLGRVVAITSAAAGAGKTTLSFALGLSYGETGSKTLLMDCDLVGRGLTTSLKSFIRRQARRTIEGEYEAERVDNGETTGETNLVSMLLDTTKVDEDEEQPGLDELLTQAQDLQSTTELPMGDLVRMLDVLATQEELERRRAGLPEPVSGNGNGVRAYDERRAVGLLDALEGAPLEDSVVNVGLPNLDVLTVGRAGERDTGKLSAGRIRRLLEVARASYDHVIIDTGPILGSLEAAMVVTEADAVVLTVCKGDLRPLSAEALDRLTEIGANVVGSVLNKADMVDVLHSSFSQYSKFTRSGKDEEA